MKCPTASSFSPALAGTQHIKSAAMAHESGNVNSFREALIEIRLLNAEGIECVVDTGFDGGVMLPRTFAERLQIPVIGRLAFEMVGGTRLFAQVGLAEIEWLDRVRQIELIISEGNDALIGTELLAGTILTVDYVAGIVTISEV
jgi:predicted aspartyl protease